MPKSWKFALLLLLVLASPTLAQSISKTTQMDFLAYQTVEPVTLTGHRVGYVMSVAFSPDGTLLASGGSQDDNTILVRSTETQEIITKLEGHDGYVSGVSFTPDGNILASASGDNTVKLWDTTTWEEIITLQGSNELFNQALNPDGTSVAAGTLERVHLWSVPTGQEIGPLQGHDTWVSGVAFSPDGSTLASSDVLGVVIFWNLQTGEQQRSFEAHTPFTVLGLAFSPDGTTLATASGDETIKLWRTDTGEEIMTLRGHTDAVLALAFTSDGRTLASGSRDTTIKLWRTATGEEITTLRGHTGAVNCVAFSPDGEVLASASSDNTEKLWGVATE